MALMKGAAHKLFGGHDGAMSEHRGVVLHVNESNGNLDNWVRDQSHNMSCHFEVYKTGAITQYVDTALASWCQMDGNASWISMETEGYATEALTDAQVKACGHIMAFAHRVHGVPIQPADHPSGKGLGWHGMGGDAWGGHYGCPGDKRKAQRDEILHHARVLLGMAHAPSAPIPHPVPDRPPVPFEFESDGRHSSGIVSHHGQYLATVNDQGQLVIHKAGVDAPVRHV